MSVVTSAPLTSYPPRARRKPGSGPECPAWLDAGLSVQRDPMTCGAGRPGHASDCGLISNYRRIRATEVLHSFRHSDGAEPRHERVGVGARHHRLLTNASSVHVYGLAIGPGRVGWADDSSGGAPVWSRTYSTTGPLTLGNTTMPGSADSHGGLRHVRHPHRLLRTPATSRRSPTERARPSSRMRASTSACPNPTRLSTPVEQALVSHRPQYFPLRRPNPGIRRLGEQPGESLRRLPQLRAI